MRPNVTIEIDPIPNLPKWPEMRVQGRPITTDDAYRLILRLGSHAFSAHACNDRQWCATVRRVVGMPEAPSGWVDEPIDVLRNRYEREAERKRQLGCVDVTYIGLDYRIASAYVGGCVGWCSWSGQISYAGHNIGKWPSVEEVAAEWGAVAAAFPVLDLRAQLFSGERCEEGTYPVVDFVVKDGAVRVTSPGAEIRGAGTDFAGQIDRILSGNRSERGCTEEQISHAVALCEEAE